MSGSLRERAWGESPRLCPLSAESDIRCVRAWKSLLLPILFIVANSASGQETRVYLGSGPVFPAGPGDVVDFWNRGLTFDISMGQRIADRLEVTLGVGQARLPIEPNKLLASGADLETSGGDFSVLSARLGIRLEFERGTWFRPYLHLGVGGYRIAFEELRIVVENPEVFCGAASCALTFAPSERPDETVLGLQLGAGVAYYLNDCLWLYAEPSYHIMFASERTGMVPLRLGIAKAF